MLLYVDESGVLDHKEKYFIIAGILTKNKAGNQFIKRTMAKAYNLYIKDTFKKELHGSELGSVQKYNIIKKLCMSEDCEIFFLVVDKQELQPRLFLKTAETFNYLFGMMLKLIIPCVTEDLHIKVDNRNVKVTAPRHLEGYIQTLAFSQWDFSHHIQIEYVDSRDCVGVQAVDLIANSVYGFYNYSNNTSYEFLKNKKCVKFPYKAFALKNS